MLDTAIAVVLLVSMYVALPAALIWGWVRWFRQAQPRAFFPVLSLAGFALATASGLLAISSAVYAQVIGGFPYYDPSLLGIYRWGGLLSVVGVVLALGAVWRPSPLRWHALACSLGTLVWWIAAATSE